VLRCVGTATEQRFRRSWVEIRVVWGGHFSLLQNMITIRGSHASSYPVFIGVLRAGHTTRRMEGWNLRIFFAYMCSVISLSRKRFSSRPTLLCLFEFPLIHTVDIGMGKEHSVCCKVVTDTGCVDCWSQSCVRCMSCRECLRIVECDPQFNL
jgi:hypothetical protein